MANAKRNKKCKIQILTIKNNVNENWHHFVFNVITNHKHLKKKEANNQFINCERSIFSVLYIEIPHFSTISFDNFLWTLIGTINNKWLRRFSLFLFNFRVNFLSFVWVQIQMAYLGEKFAVQFNENLLAEKMKTKNYIWREFHFPFKHLSSHIQRELCFGRNTKFMDRKFGIDERFDTEILIENFARKLNHFRIVQLNKKKINKNCFQHWKYVPRYSKWKQIWF